MNLDAFVKKHCARGTSQVGYFEACFQGQPLIRSVLVAMI